MTDINPTTEEKKVVEEAAADITPITAYGKGHQGYLKPALSEKTHKLSGQNKYVFYVHGNLNKVEIKKSLEKSEGKKISQLNTITVQAKPKNYGKYAYSKNGLKKVIVTFTDKSSK